MSFNFDKWRQVFHYPLSADAFRSYRQFRSRNCDRNLEIFKSMPFVTSPPFSLRRTSRPLCLPQATADAPPKSISTVPRLSCCSFAASCSRVSFDSGAMAMRLELVTSYLRPKRYFFIGKYPRRCHCRAATGRVHLQP